MLADLNKTKEPKGYTKFSHQGNKIKSSKSQVNSGKNAFATMPKHGNSEYLHDESLHLPMNESIEERGD